jgi:hypothetical protein
MGNILTVTTAGSIVLDANQAGTSNYNAAPQVQQALVVNKAGPVVVVTQIDDGTAQRSMVRSITLAVSPAITTTTQMNQLVGQLSLSRVGGLSGTLTLNGSLAGGGTQVVLTFSGSSIIGGSLPDGRYTLSGTPLATPLQLWRLYGDLYGNGSVTSADVAAFNTAYGLNGTRKGMPTYNVYLDYYANGLINLTDKQQFQLRVGLSV